MAKIRANINGEYLKELRRERGLSGIKVASLLGVSESTYYKWEGNRQVPSILKLQILQIIYKGLDYNKLLSLEFKKCYNKRIDRKGGKGENR